jgi:methionyl-tRNA formyltransferase
MTLIPEWWGKPRRVAVVVDNPSWILPFAEKLVRELNDSDDEAVLCRSHKEIPEGDVAFYLGCVKMTPPGILAKNKQNMVVHESDLPKGRGFSPLTWQILEGLNKISICLLEAADEADAGPVIYRDLVCFEGHELIDEMRKAQGEKSTALCQRFLNEPVPLDGELQVGEPSSYSRRKPHDSRLDTEKSIAEQFNLLRVVDNERYPAFFELYGHRYQVKIQKIS